MLNYVDNWLCYIYDQLYVIIIYNQLEYNWLYIIIIYNKLIILFFNFWLYLLRLDCNFSLNKK